MTIRRTLLTLGCVALVFTGSGRMSGSAERNMGEATVRLEGLPGQRIRLVVNAPGKKALDLTLGGLPDSRVSIEFEKSRLEFDGSTEFVLVDLDSKAKK